MNGRKRIAIIQAMAELGLFFCVITTGRRRKVRKYRIRTIVFSNICSALSYFLSENQVMLSCIP
jgi:hypothetical protein